jgi:glucosamine 6-phosphate synthetase-like amidotransferase/phosphosugar isomerase protein
MCGLTGYNTKAGVILTPEQKKIRGQILKGLLLACQERGTHSTGVAGVCEEHKWCYTKQATSAEMFIQTPDFKEFINHAPRVVVGHTRFATVGNINNKNAHPFNVGGIVGAHNGHVSNWKEVYSEGEVDSEAIFYALNKHQNNFKKALKEVRGKFAITWFSEDNLDKLYLVVDENPLSLVRVKELETYFWCSTLLPLQSIIGSHFELKGKKFWSPKKEYVYTIDGKHNTTKTPIEFGKYVYSNYTGYNSKSCGVNPKASTNYEDWRAREDKTQEEEKRKIEAVARSTLLMGGTVAENYSKVMDLGETEMKEIDRLTQEGCGFCSALIDYENNGVYYHQTEHLVMCHHCAEEWGDFSNVLYVDPEDFLSIEAEVFEMEEERRELLAQGISQIRNYYD